MNNKFKESELTMSGEVCRLEEMLCTVGEQLWPWMRKALYSIFPS